VASLLLAPDASTSHEHESGERFVLIAVGSTALQGRLHSLTPWHEQTSNTVRGLMPCAKRTTKVGYPPSNGRVGMGHLACNFLDTDNAGQKKFRKEKQATKNKKKKSSSLVGTKRLRVVYFSKAKARWKNKLV
jgi:hypothetical protein